MGICCRKLACLVAASLLAAAASAQQSYDQWSLEALTAQAKAVFKGTLTNIIKFPAASKPGGPPRVSLLLTVQIEDRIKGSTDSWMTLSRDVDASDGRYDAWMKSKAPMLWFAFSEEEPRPFPGSTVGPGLKLPPGNSWTAVHLSAPDPAELPFDPHAADGAFKLDLSVVKEGKDKLAAAREFTKVVPDRAKVCRLLLPSVATAAVGYNSGVQHVILPITAELEPIAQKMIASPEAFLPKDHAPTDVTAIRAAGVRALGNFQTDKNVALLKSLLTDPGKGPGDANETPVKTFYWVRLAAFDVLTGWNVKVSKPPLS